ncbi:actin family protein [Cryptosporidium muris RN66]|uniref:Actin family protein n=1 Tax=Cryptosporidium muris (strain RN66) TaxID=441375 RepID=B6AAT9_CRYMR|nr:actin family protein [Cryptosporidium muris RN66]EEA05491.1 actin family protein [Cryptosporidium muris RN66]|eukprot:XP_002139840.1 actin family protein [Cryptosporidium muris RN66]
MEDKDFVTKTDYWPISKSCIVLNIGRKYIKVGFSNSLRPLAILQVGELWDECFDRFRIENKNRESIGKVINQDDVLDDDQREPHVKFNQLTNDISNNSDSDCRINRNKLVFNYVDKIKHLGKWKIKWLLFLQELYTSYLKCNPKDYSVILVEKVLFPDSIRNCIIDYLIKDMGISGICTIEEPLAALYTSGIPTGIVVDIGISETVIYPVYNGYPIIQSIIILNFGYNQIIDYFKRILIRQLDVINEDKEEDITNNELTLIKSLQDPIFEDILFQCGIVKPQNNDIIDESNSDVIGNFEYNYISNDGMIYQIISIDQYSRTQPFELFFGDDKYDSEIVYDIVIDGIIPSIKACNIDIRKEIVQNILVSGGIAATYGFEQRLLSELKSTIGLDPKLEPLGKFINIISPPISPFIRSYSGASIYASLPGLNFITSKEIVH